jgi:hypothetical protein
MGSLRTLRHQHPRVVADIETEYVRLKGDWLNLVNQYRTIPLSVLKLRPPYKAIVNLGRPAVPLMLEDLEADREYLISLNNDDHVIENYPWFTAIEEIIGRSVVTYQRPVTLKTVIDLYIGWGRSVGYLRKIEPG